MGKKLYKLGIMVVSCLLIFVGVIACDKNAIDPDDSEKEYEEINFGRMRNLERESEKKIEVDETAYNLSFSPDGSRFVYYQASLWPMFRSPVLRLIQKTLNHIFPYMTRTAEKPISSSHRYACLIISELQ